jgi:hypothetical protein
MCLQIIGIASDSPLNTSEMAQNGVFDAHFSNFSPSPPQRLVAPLVGLHDLIDVIHKCLSIIFKFRIVTQYAGVRFNDVNGSVIEPKHDCVPAGWINGKKLLWPRTDNNKELYQLYKNNAVPGSDWRSYDILKVSN